MTIYKNEYGEIDFWPEELNKHKKIMINFSCGTDSTLVTWMLCEKLTKLKSNLQINFSTLVDTERPTNEWNARELVLWFKEMYDLNWGEHYVGYYTKGSDNGNREKGHYHQLHNETIRKPNELTLLTHGRTANPPLSVRKKFNLDQNREEARDIPIEKIRGGEYQSYSPLVTVAKDFVAQVYKDNNIMDLFKLTASCISKGPETEYFTKPCKTCWWCREKLWAFGCYDYGHM